MRAQLIAGLVAAALGGTLAAQNNPTRIAIRAGRVIDGRGGAPISNAIIAIERGKIASVTAGGTAPTGVELIDLSNTTVLPGLIDTHTHIFLQGDATSAEYRHSS